MKILTLNIGSPSLERAKKQVEWLDKREEDVYILTETRNGEGCNFIEQYFVNYGMDLFSLGSDKKYYVYYPKSSTGDLGVMIVSKLPFISTFTICQEDSIFYSRATGCEIEYEGKPFKILGLYVPSRDTSQEKINRKKQFCAEVANYLNQNSVDLIAGDLNILERAHIPHYSNFLDFEYRFYDFLINKNYIDTWKVKNEGKLEYSWVGRTNDGYRYDYVFLRDKLNSNLLESSFVHETRTTNKITDHSGITVTLR